MQLKLGDKIVNLGEVEMETPITSKHTGCELEKFSFTIDVQRTYNDDFETLLKGIKNGGIFSIVDDRIIKEYKLLNRSYSYSNNESPYRYTLTIEEVERLKLDSLVINGFEIQPYEYSEEYDNGIIINTKWRVSNEDKIALNNTIGEHTYFKVIRNGISEKEIEMRFGKVLWSEDNGFIKEKVVLVEKVYDENKESTHRFLQPELDNIKEMLVQTTSLYNCLIELLIEKGSITSSELEKVKERAKQEEAKLFNKFFEVHDIDTY